MNQHSNFIGGSNAAARIACPASWQMEQKLPPAARKETSAYADEGSALHAAMADALNNDLLASDLADRVYEPWTDWPITQEHLNEALAPCLAYFEKLDDEMGGLAFYVEKRVEIPFLPGVFGTCDLIAKGPQGSVIGDWKFGSGESV